MCHQLDNNTVILFQYGRFPECMIITYWRRLWALWKVECIFMSLSYSGYCSILPVFMDFHMSINPLISFPIKTISCIILIFVIFSHNILSVGFSSALKGNWKGIDKRELELELELIKRNWNWNCCFFIPEELELELDLNVEELELELNWKKGIVPSPAFDITLIQSSPRSGIPPMLTSSNSVIR